MDTQIDDTSTIKKESNRSKFIVPAALLGLSGLVGAGTFLYFNNSSFKLTPTTNNVQVEDPQVEGTSSSNLKVLNGKYTALGIYKSPAGEEEIEVTLQIDNGLITNALVVSKATVDTSIKYQKEFIDGFKEQVIGKDINQLRLVKVSGSSLTPKGFNDALDKIREQANNTQG